MTDIRCENVRVSLALGETQDVAQHLVRCEGCRSEAAKIDRVVARLSTTALIEPPPNIDARMRSLLAAEPRGVALRPWLAGGLAVASFTALVAAVAVVLSYTPVAEYSVVLALALGTAYLALSAAAALPLMIQAANHQLRPAEVRT